ncbi:asparagine synthase (glutamine-hydrolyzing) [Rhodospira trueperi]|uniref:asparagine synthase (glutamine-hydrolyzing) n=1 Tax=Rhodospira trueperi TaxID=69960 RepID=A0A1G7GPQ7_9PROT|nr:asparagine synthase (glutamine-hydrolyzing) [Rhodospira trueperi]SDE90130.1 asparagine synthase (glutamine-hydrolysing) [Rhodospira trueperi]
MCGLVATVHAGPLADEQRTALDRLAHRGPDGTACWQSVDGSVWLGHRRLAIVDLSEAGRQPMVSPCGHIAMAANNEIYNAPDLRRELEDGGFAFASECDSEVILHGYRAWGPGVVERLEGMFAFVLWDGVQRRLLAARDRLGIKPLYLAETSAGFVFASEAEAVRALLPESPTVAPEALAYVMTLGYVPAPLSVWQGIEKLEPATVLTWQPGERARRRRYWEPPAALDGADSPTRFAALFEATVARHLMADVPVSLLLSGGIDSTAVALGLTHLDRTGIEAYTVDFGGADEEAEIAAETAAHLSLTHRPIRLPGVDIDSLAHCVARDFDEPQGYSALLTMHRVSAAVAAKHRVVLAGDGGDEVFGGYRWYDEAETDARNSPSPGGPRPPWYARLAARAVGRVNRPDTLARRDPAAAWRAFAARSPLHAHASRLFPRFLPEEAEALLAPTGLRFDEERMLEPLRRHYRSNLPLRRALQRVDLMTFCTDSILAKVDRASMAHSLEVRVPLLDHRVVEYGLSLPLMAEEGQASKPTLRRYLEGQVPARVAGHPKRGFSLASNEGIDWDAARSDVLNASLVRKGVWSRRIGALLDADHPYKPARLLTLAAIARWSDAHRI